MVYISAPHPANLYRVPGSKLWNGMMGIRGDGGIRGPAIVVIQLGFDDARLGIPPQRTLENVKRISQALSELGVHVYALCLFYEI